MTGPPGATSNNDEGEHPVDAATQAAHRAVPIPHQPLTRSVWGARAVLLLPAAIGGFGLYRHLMAPVEAGRLALALVALVALLVFLGLGW